MPKVSVVIAVYNVGKYLRKCLDSLLEQTLTDIEIVAVDDGSTDESGRLCDQYAARDPRIRTIHQQNAGVSAARNEGIRHASGDYVAFVDGDDWAEPDMLEAAYAAAERTGAELVMWNNYWNRPGSESRTAMYTGDARLLAGDQVEAIQRLIIDSSLAEAGCISNATFVWCKLWRRDTLTRHAGGWYAEGLRWGEDQIFNLKFLGEVRQAAYISQTLYHYRVTPESVTNAFRQDRPEMFAHYLAELERFVHTQKPDDASFRKAYYKRVVYTLILAVRTHFCNRNNRKPLGAKAGELKRMIVSEPYAEALLRVQPGDFGRERGVFVALAQRKAALPLLLLSRAKGAISSGRT